MKKKPRTIVVDSKVIDGSIRQFVKATEGVVVDKLVYVVTKDGVVCFAKEKLDDNS